MIKFNCVYDLDGYTTAPFLLKKLFQGKNPNHNLRKEGGFKGIIVFELGGFI